MFLVHFSSVQLLNHVRLFVTPWTAARQASLSFTIFQYVYVLAAQSVRLFATPGTVAHQAPLSTKFSRQEFWSELPFLYPGDLPNMGIKPGSPALQMDSLSSEPPGKLRVCSNYSVLDFFIEM